MAEPKREQRDEGGEAYELIERIISRYPKRRAGSSDERRAQQLVQAELERLGLLTEVVGFDFCDNLYRAIALHFGAGTLGSMLGKRAPLAALALHLGAASYWALSTHRAPIVHPLLPRGRSQNLLATMAAEEPLTLRLVIAAHIDAGFHGLPFSPGLGPLAGSAFAHSALGLLGPPLALVTHSQLVLAGIALMRLLGAGRGFAPTWLRAALSVPGVLATVLSADVARRDQVVPGANDDLSGVAGALLLARRLAPRKPADVEIVFAITGAEEVGLAGARALADSGLWDRERTVVVALDGLTNGSLRYFLEGEIERVAIPRWIEQALRDVIASEERFATVSPFAIPVGGTDNYAFRQRGFDGVSVGCVDAELGSPRHYHQPSDTAANLDIEQLMLSVDFAERLIETIIERRGSQRRS